MDLANSSTDPRHYTISARLTAAECNAQKEMSLPNLVQRLIDVSTAHADSLGIGYDRLLEDHNAWVLSRVSIELWTLPAIGQRYELTTWVEGINRHFSERNIEIAVEGCTVGYARLIWVAINMRTRRPADLTPIIPLVTISDRRCPIEPFPRLAAIDEPDHISTYRFKYSDIDFNRHVNSTRYVQLIFDCWDMTFYDHHRVSRFDITYLAEAHDGEVVEVRRKGDEALRDVELARNGSLVTRARIAFASRHARE